MGRSLAPRVSWLRRVSFCETQGRGREWAAQEAVDGQQLEEAVDGVKGGQCPSKGGCWVSILG